MKRKIRNETHVSVEMSDTQSNNIRIILFNMQDRHIKEILNMAGVAQKHFGNIKEDLQELCMELEIFDVDRGIDCDED